MQQFVLDANFTDTAFTATPATFPNKLPLSAAPESDKNFANNPVSTAGGNTHAKSVGTNPDPRPRK